ncbi:MAG: GldG family protein [Candidatus Peregrinibacteria bacterium]
MNFSCYKKTLWFSYLLTVLVIGITVMVGFISTEHFVRLDLTDNRAFVIDASSKAVLRGLNDIVTAKVFFSDELPPNLFMVRQYVEDVLNEFESYAGGNLNVHFFDMSQDEVMEEAKRLGIPAIRMNILSRDKFEVKNGFLGVALMYGDKHEILPVVQEARNVEYDLISAISKLTNPQLRHIGFVKGHNEYPIVSKTGTSQGNGYLTVHDVLQKNSEVSVLSLTDPDALAAVDTLVIGGPEMPFTLREKFALDQYLMKGGNVIFLLDGVHVDDFREATLLDIELGDLLAHYGVSVLPQLALDPINETTSFDEGLIDFIVPYPFWVKAVRDNFDPESPITSKLDAVVLPWVSPLEVLETEETQATTLLRTSDDAWLQDAPFDLDPSVIAPAQTHQYPLAVLLDGVFKSYYAGGQAPRGFVSESNGQGRILVVGNSRFLTDRMVRDYKQNLNFFLNAVDFLTLDQSFIGIRSKVVADRPLIKLSDNEREVLKLGGIFLMPALVVIYGLLRSIDRKKKKIKL